MHDRSPTRAAALAAGLATALACAGQAASDPFALASMDEVEKMLGAPDVAIVDANPRDVFEKHHLPGARHYKSAPFAQVLPADKETRLVFYCASPS